MALAPLAMRPFGFNVIGPVSANVGLGVTARNIAGVLRRRGYPLAILDIDPGRGRGGHDSTYESFMVKTAADLPYAVNLSILSLTALPDFIVDRPALLGRDTLNAGFFVWELPAISQVWKRSLEFFDVLVAESDFIRGTFENAVSHVPTISCVHPLSLPEAIRAERARFGLPEQAIIFVCIVDPTSDARRKNPFAAIEAFRGALGDDPRAHLVVKINNASHQGKAHSLVPEVRAQCASHPRIRLIEEALSYDDVLSLYKSCDVFVALHRSEGLGLGPMEAMALGKPVVATGWSGNMTYMDYTDACLVRYRLIPVDGALPVYTRRFLGTEAFWAEPDIEHAAAWMSRLAAEPDYRSAMGRRAAQRMREYTREAEAARFADELQAIWESRSFLPRRPEFSAKDVTALRELSFEQFASPTQIAARRGLRMLDRHLLWRFRSR
jgi:glycosyltransferase involved in cell wall biosynthesis